MVATILGSNHGYLITTIHVNFHVLVFNFYGVLGMEPRSLLVRQVFCHWDTLPAPTLLFQLDNRVGYVEFCIVAWSNKKYTFWFSSLILIELSKTCNFLSSKDDRIIFFCSKIWFLSLVPKTKLLNLLGDRSVFCFNTAACGGCIDAFKMGLVSWNNKHWLETLALLVSRKGRGTGDWV